MKKKYKSLKKTWWIIPLYSIIPIGDVIFGEYLGLYFWIKLIMYIGCSIVIYNSSRRTVAEICDGRIIFYEGVGIYDPSNLGLEQINHIERKGKRLLSFIYDKEKVVSIESTKNVLDQIESDFMAIL